MPFIHEQRKLLRSLAVGATVVGTLAVASPASAALGGGPAAQFTDRPNLQSVTFDGDIGAFTFDVTVQAPPGGLDENDFVVGGYRASIVNSDSTAGAVVIDALNPDTVLVEYDQDTDDVDFNAATFGAVDSNAVRGIGTYNNGNFHDATGLTGADGENGTRGRTAGPDLQSVAVNSGLNRITYTFDQDVTEDPVPDRRNFGYVQADGDLLVATSISVDGNEVDATFAAVDDVDTARQAFVTDFFGNDVDAAETQAAGPPQANVTVPGKNPLTDRPSLTSVEIEGSGTLLFTFDQPVGDPAPGAFSAVLSNGVAVSAGGAAVVGGNVVRATFDTSQFSEHIVFGSVERNAVDSAGNSNYSTPSGKPAGGNAGAKASGYTTAPDAISATINRASGQVSVLFDSRILVDPSSLDEDDFDLYSEDGVALTTQPNGVFVTQTTGPSQARVVLQFDPEDTAVADFIQVEGQRVDHGVGGSLDWGNDFAVEGTILGNGGTVPDSQYDNRNVETIIVPTETSTGFSK